MIEKPQLQQLRIADLKFDVDNPNFMSEDQMNVLRESFKKYGNLHPITVDQNNLIADGEHRVKVYQENNEEFIEGYKLEISDLERRMLRQIMNKNRGQHLPEKDYSELVMLISNKDNSELLNMMGINQGTLSELSDIITSNKTLSLEEISNMEQDGNPTEHYADSFLFGNIKQITTYLDNATYEDAIKKLQVLMDKLQIDNHTDLIWTIINYIYSNRDNFNNIEVLHVTPPTKQKVNYEYLPST